MSLPALPTSWNLYNLTSSPFFQGTLESGDQSLRPLTLFVGRTAELARLRAKVHGAGLGSSHQAVVGVPGVGKTTLVQELKASLLKDGYLTTDELIPVLAGDTTESLFGRVLASLYDTILVNRPQSHGSQAMQDAQLLVRAAKFGSGGGSLSILGIGGGMTKGTTVVTPKEILFDGPRIMRDLMVLVRGSDARGAVLHLNNLENLSEADAKGAGEVLRSLRDIMLMHDGLHYIVVGTTDAINATVNQHVQVRSVFDTLMLEPMAVADVHRMLEERYAHLRADPGRPIIAPVTADAVEQLYALFRGDLRGLLKALDDGVGQLIGLAGVEPEGGAAPVRPLTLGELGQVLQHRYSAQLATVAERGRVEQLTTWGRSDPASSHTQKSLQQLWGISQGSVSAAVTQLTALGYVVPLPRTSGQPMQYVLSGVSRLIFGSVPSEGTAAR